MNIPISQGFDTNIVNTQQSSRPTRKNKTLAEIKEIQQSLINNFKDIKDPRVDRTKKHLLIDILVIAILAIIAGAEGWEDIENYGICKQVWLEQFLELPNGIPSDDTFRRMFQSINPTQLEQCFQAWINTLVTQMGGQVIPIDGKTVRGSYDRNQNKSALHLINENGYYIFNESEPFKRIDYDIEVFRQIDLDIAPIIKKILADQTITNLEAKEIKTLTKYTVYQYLRVPQIRNIAKSLKNDKEEEARKLHAEALRNDKYIVSTLEAILISLRLDIIKPIPGNEFVILDAPILLDPTGEGIYFPISSDICLVYYHPNYDIVNCLDSICINQIQYLASEQFLVAKNKLTLDKIKNLAHKNHIERMLKKSGNNCYWKCILEKKNSEICILEMNRDSILEPLKNEYDMLKALRIY